MKNSILIFLCVLFLPALAHAEVHITEIAWMGTVMSQYSEWFELHNEGSTSVDLAGWKLYEGNSTLVFTLTKAIAADGYLLVERSTASAPDAIPGINDESGSFGGGGFANTGESLTLKDDNGNIVETLDFSGGWPAGDAKTKETMQWNGSTWVTASATPNAATSNTAQDTTGTIPEKTTPNKTLDLFPIPKVSPNKPHIEFTVPDTVYQGMPYQFQARPVLEYNYKIDSGNYLWNMGDGTLLYQHEYAPLTHTYQYPGTYTISFAFADPFNKNNNLSGTKTVTVTAPAITIQILKDKALELKNSSPTPVDLTQWQLVMPDKTMYMPDMTVIAEHATIAIPFSILSVDHPSSASLADPSGVIVATTAPSPRILSQEIATSVMSTRRVSNKPLVVDTQLVASTLPIESTPSSQTNTPKRNRTKTIIFGAAALFVIVLSILLERVMARQEYQ